MFLEIVRKLPDSDITIETDASFKVVITCEKAKFTIIGKSGEDFSYLPAVEKDDSIVMSQFTLKEVVRQTIFSISDNDNNKLNFLILTEKSSRSCPWTDTVSPFVRSS